LDVEGRSRLVIAEKQIPGLFVRLDPLALQRRRQNKLPRRPYPHEYRAWSGPNSNTSTAYIARQVPELGVDLPSNAIGKDFLPEGALFAKAPSGSGCQVSLYGLAGIVLAGEEGLEVNVLGLNHRPSTPPCRH
jgi:hypothetical protein